jgi:hypothetical protein
MQLFLNLSTQILVSGFKAALQRNLTQKFPLSHTPNSSIYKFIESIRIFLYDISNEITAAFARNALLQERYYKEQSDLYAMIKSLLFLTELRKHGKWTH